MSDPTGPARRYAPATERNREPIAAILREVLPARGSVLEIASGTGEHCVHFARAFPHLQWQPSDADPAALTSIAAWTDGLANVARPIAIDAGAPNWPVVDADALLCINMIHISPWAATLGLLAGAARVLRKGAPLILYGPYIRDDVPTAPSNEAFDRWLNDRDSAWGLRRLEAVSEAARSAGFAFDRLVEMPANNLTLVYRRD